MARRRLRSSIALCCIHLLMPHAAIASCSSPAAAEGDIIYNQAYHTYQYCGGANWVSFAELDPAAGGGGCSNPTQPEGYLFYNNDYHTVQFCNGTNWISVGQSGSSGGGAA